MEAQNANGKQNSNQRLDVVALDIDDLNALISILKRREENIIQMLDYNLKYKYSHRDEEIKQLRTLQNQLIDLEKTRKLKEEQIQTKYLNVKVTDGKQKRLVLKLVSKIIQLNASVKEKLTELDIYEKTKVSFKGIQPFEDNLKALSNRSVIDIEVVINYIVKHSQYRLERELDPDYDYKNKITEFELLNYLFDARNQNFNRDKDLEKENGKQNGIKKPPEQNQSNGNNSNGSPPRNRPSLQKSLTKDLGPNQTNSSTSNDKKRELVKVINNSLNDPSMMMPKTIPIKPIEKNITKQMSYSSVERHIEKNLTENTPTIPGKRELQELTSQNGMIINKNIKGNKSNKSIASLEDLSGVVAELKQDKIGVPLNRIQNAPAFDIWKSYDILKIEPRQIPTTLKHKKVMMEKVFNELISYNFEIKRGITKYKQDYVSYNDRKKVRPRSNHGDGSANRPQRSQISTPTTNVTQTSQSTTKNTSASLPATSSNNPSVKTRNEYLNQRYPSAMNVINDGMLSPPNHSQKSKPQKVVVLPKLHLFEEQGQNSTIQSQGTPKLESNPKNRFFVANDRPKSELLENGSPQKMPYENLVEMGYAKSYSPFRENVLQKNYSPQLREIVKDGYKEFSPSMRPMKGLNSILGRFNEEPVPLGKPGLMEGAFVGITGKKGLLESEDRINRMKFEYYSQAQPMMSRISALQNSRSQI